MESIFQQVYEENLWNGVESRSGPGSGPSATKRIADTIVRLVADRDIRSVIDVGCGDGFWMPDLPGYIGIDPAKAAILLSRERHPDRTYIWGDIRSTSMHADLIIIRDVLQHLDVDEAHGLLKGCFARAKWVLASTYLDGENTGITPEELLRGKAYMNDLEKPPFSLPHPVMVIPDGYDYADPERTRDFRKFLGLWPT